MYIWCEVKLCLYFFLCGYPIILALFVEKSILLPQNYFGTFVKSVNFICLGVFLNSVSFFPAPALYLVRIVEGSCFSDWPASLSLGNYHCLTLFTSLLLMKRIQSEGSFSPARRLVEVWTCDPGQGNQSTF